MENTISTTEAQTEEEPQKNLAHNLPAATATPYKKKQKKTWED